MRSAPRLRACSWRSLLSEGGARQPSPEFMCGEPRVGMSRLGGSAGLTDVRLPLQLLPLWPPAGSLKSSWPACRRAAAATAAVGNLTQLQWLPCVQTLARKRGMSTLPPLMACCRLPLGPLPCRAAGQPSGGPCGAAAGVDHGGGSAGQPGGLVCRDQHPGAREECWQAIPAALLAQVGWAGWLACVLWATFGRGMSLASLE